jgi:hypothetical protein
VLLDDPARLGPFSGLQGIQQGAAILKVFLFS